MVDPQHHGIQMIKMGQLGMICGYSPPFRKPPLEKAPLENPPALPTPGVRMTFRVEVKEATSLHQCMARCLLYLKCQGVQYHPTTKACETRHKGHRSAGQVYFWVPTSLFSRSSGSYLGIFDNLQYRFSCYIGNIFAS